MNKVLLGIVAAAALVMTSGANAALKMTLDTGSGSSSGVLTDGDADGAIVFNGSLGEWGVNVTTGISKPLINGPTLLDLNSVNVTSTSGGSITIKLTDTDYSSGFIDYAAFLLGGTTDFKASFQAYADASNTEFGMGTLIGDFDATSGAFSYDSGFSAIPGFPYSLTIVATITHSSAGQVSSFDAAVVPEPSVLALFGLGLLGLGAVSRKRKQA